MDEKQIRINVDPDTEGVNIDWTDSFADPQEVGYYLSAAFLAFSANVGISEEDLIELIKENYQDFQEENK
ncbi:MAG: hypothetical protein Q3960_03165 [Lactobacillus sp.]|nr:hypothetical protein [Lactobacillus sp.]